MRLFYFCNANTGNILSRTSQDFWWAWSKNGNGFDCPVMNILIRYTSVPYQKNPTEQIHWWSRRRQAEITYSITLSSRNSRTGNKTKMSTPPLFSSKTALFSRLQMTLNDPIWPKKYPEMIGICMWIDWNFVPRFNTIKLLNIEIKSFNWFISILILENYQTYINPYDRAYHFNISLPDS